MCVCVCVLWPVHICFANELTAEVEKDVQK